MERESMTEIRVGIIGLGGMANVHIESISKLEGVRITALCDCSSEAVKRAGDKLSIAANRRFTRYLDLIASDEVDAVLSITPNDAHYEIVKCCLQHSKPIMTEKPFTRTFEEAYELHQLYLRNPIPSMVGFSYRYVPSFRYARDLIKQGKIGQVRHIFVQYLQSWGVPIYDTPMNWRYRSEITGTGALADLGSHMVDAARFMIGEFDEVTAQMKTFIASRRDPTTGAEGIVDVDDFTGFLATLDSQVTGVFQTSRNAYGSGNQLELQIYGELGTISVGCERGNELTWIHPNEEHPASIVTEVQIVPAHYELAQMADFFDMVRGHVREELPTIQDGFANQEVLEAIYLAAVNRRMITLAEIRADQQAAGGER
jgi:predicted dehydrogenase